MLKPKIAIVTPYLVDANNGNWRTACRWQSLLARDFGVIVQKELTSKDVASAAMLIALHARRSADVVVQFRNQFPEKPLVVVLTGTDLYRDITDDANAQRSLALATALVVLQEDAIRFVPKQYRAKTHVVYQSAPPLIPAKKPKNRINAVVVGHLRDEKSPQTIFDALTQIDPTLPIHIQHIGAGLDESLAARATALTGSNPQYRWIGALPHGLTRAAIKRSHVLIHPSIMEGGANVIVEAISAGTPVLASEMSGNVGMLGRDYPGYFPVGDARALTILLERCLTERNFLTRLNTACAARAKLFLPETERATLVHIIQSLLDQNTH